MSKFGAKSSEYTSLSRTHFLKRAYLRSFSGLTSLHSVNIQPNLNPFQKLLDPPLLKSFTVAHFVVPV